MKGRREESCLLLHAMIEEIREENNVTRKKIL